jgi:hypothetical protein
VNQYWWVKTEVKNYKKKEKKKRKKKKKKKKKGLRDSNGSH